MKLLPAKYTSVPGVRVHQFERIQDTRGYFTESFNIRNILFNVMQVNESFSKMGVMRGLHTQDRMAKYVRVLSGSIIDFFVDGNPDSNNYLVGGAYKLVANLNNSVDEWIYIPQGFYHGFYALEDSRIEYLCDRNWNQDEEKGLNFISNDIQWKDTELMNEVDMEMLLRSIKDYDLPMKVLK